MSNTAASGFMNLIPEGYYTRAQVARLIGKSKDTIIRWHENGTYEPSHEFHFGEIRVWAYTDADVEAMLEIAKTMKPGPKPVEQLKKKKIS